MIHTWQWTPFAFLVLLASLASLPEDLYEAAKLDRAGAWSRFRHITLPLLRPAIVIVVIMRAMTALSAFAAIYAATGGGPGTATEILNLYAYRMSFTQLDFGYGSALAVGAPRPHPRGLRPPLPHPHRREGRMTRPRPGALRRIVLTLVAAAILFVWAFPVLWAVVVSLKSESEVLAWPPSVFFEPTLRNYRDALTGNLSIASSLVTSIVLATATTVLTILLAVPAAYAFARLRLPARQGLGFYTLVTQMIPPVGLVIPYYLILNRVGMLDTYTGPDHRLPDLLAALRDLADGLLPRGHPARDGGGGLPRQGEPPAGALARHPAAGPRRHRRHHRLRLPQRLERVPLRRPARRQHTSGPVTVAMHNFVSIEQTLWAKLAAAALIAMLPVIVIGILAQRQIVKGLTVGAVKGGGRR